MKKILVILGLIGLVIFLLFLGLKKTNTPTIEVVTPTENATSTTSVATSTESSENISSQNTGTNIPQVTPVGTTPVVTTAEIKIFLESAEQALKKGDKGTAWRQYSLAMKQNLDSANRKKISRILEPIVVELCGQAELTNCTVYAIQPGDNMTKIAKKYKTTIGLIKEINNKKNDNIVAGHKLKVIPQNLVIEVYKSSFFLIVYLENGLYYRSYEVGLGKENKTPIGNFIIKQKEKEPTWTTEDENGRKIRIPFKDPRHKIGTRWMGFEHDGIGIHGTVEPDSIGKNMSNGCVRMRNEDVEKLFDLVDYTTKVAIKP